LYELKFHGLGGEGIVTVGELMAKAAIVDGKWAQSLPYFSTERRGSPVMASVRIDNSPIWIKSFVQNPDLVAVTNESVMKFIDVGEGLREKGTLLINTSKPEKQLQAGKPYTVHTINATEIATQIIKSPIANTVMLGAVLAVDDVVSFQSLTEAVKDAFPTEMAARNITAMEAAYKMIKELEEPATSLARK